MSTVANPYVASFGWINSPPDPDVVDDELLEISGLSSADVAGDFRVLIAATAKASSSEPHIVASGQIRNIGRYIEGALREDAAGAIVNVASTYPAATIVDDVALSESAQAFWHSGVLIDLLTDVLSPQVRRAGHRVGCVQVFYDATSNQIETSVRLVRRGQCSLEISINQPLSASPAWVDQLQDATATAARIAGEPGDAIPAEPDAEIEVSELATAVAAAIKSGAKTFAGSGTTIAAELTRTELAAALGKPIATLEIAYSGAEGTLLVWEPQSQLPHALLLAS